MAKRVSVDVALQGGGAHGALTWGVLDRLVEEPDLQIVGVSGTSAGAMNAVALAQGLASGGPDGAKQLLETFWTRVSEAAAFSPFQQNMMERFWGRWSRHFSPGYMWLDTLSRAFSPYELNPMQLNPLRDLVTETFDFDLVNSAAAPRVFQSATNVRTGNLKIFGPPHISADTTLASACLPTLYQAVEIDGEAYWDGGYMGNPPLLPLVEATPARDVILVLINPFRRDELPRTGAEIQNRLNEITFNAGLINELRGLGHVVRLVDGAGFDKGAYRDGRLHRISAEDAMKGLSVASKMNAEMTFLRRLFDIGRDAADRWFNAHRADLGRRTSWDPSFVMQVMSEIGPEGAAP
ncbi:MAG: patatin-like phospholipase family protein [Pseudomonadota bacterium]